jgi:hypothetical protein
MTKNKVQCFIQHDWLARIASHKKDTKTLHFLIANNRLAQPTIDFLKGKRIQFPSDSELQSWYETTAKKKRNRKILALVLTTMFLALLLYVIFKF